MKKQMLKILVVALCVGMLSAVCCSCNQNDQTAETTAATQTQQQTEATSNADSTTTTQSSEGNETQAPQDTSAESVTAEYDNINTGWTDGWN